MKQISLRDAQPNDLAILEYWDTLQHIQEASGNDEELNDWEWKKALSENPFWREQLIAELDGTPIGFIQIIDPYEEETHYWGEVPQHLRAIDIWIGEEKEIGKGYGTQMMNQALERCFADEKVWGVLIDPLVSNTRAHRFYESLGFQFQEERQFGEDLCRVYFFKRENWQEQKS